LSFVLLMVFCSVIHLMADLIVFNLETNIIIESYDVTFDETAPCPRDVFECAGDKEMEESNFVTEEL
jgi:hypothetical protein